MSSRWTRGFGYGVDEALWVLFVILLVFLGLGLWKLVDLIQAAL